MILTSCTKHDVTPTGKDKEINCDIIKTPLVVIIFGQSNADGTAQREELLGTKYENIHLDDSIKVWNTRWENIDYSNNVYNQSFDFGLEVSLSQELKERTKREVKIIKLAVGGSCLFNNQIIPNWNVKGFDLLYDFTYKVNTALYSLNKYEIYKTIYYQGETDTYNKEWANSYEYNLYEMIDFVKSNTPIKEIQIVRIQDEYKNKVGYNTVRSVQEGFDYIDTDDLPLNNIGNPQHISGEGLIELGKRLL